MLRLLDELGNDPAIGRDAQLVLVDKNLEELPPELVSRKVRYMRGDPTRNETLQCTGIHTASHVIVLTRNPGDPLSDALNVTIALAIEGRAPGQYRGGVHLSGYRRAPAKGGLRPHRLQRAF